MEQLKNLKQFVQDTGKKYGSGSTGQTVAKEIEAEINKHIEDLRKEVKPPENTKQSPRLETK